MFDFMGAWEAAQAEWDDPNSAMMKMHEEAQRSFDYLNDPAIPEHEKDLQMALDHDISDPRPEIERRRKIYEYWCRTGDLPGDDMYEVRSVGVGSGSMEEYVELLRNSISEENVKQRLEEYEEHLALRKEAIEKGFVKGGYGRKQGDA